MDIVKINISVFFWVNFFQMVIFITMQKNNVLLTFVV
jgi:hypothetical protein